MKASLTESAVLELEQYLDTPRKTNRPQHEGLITAKLLHWDAGARCDGLGGTVVAQPASWHITPAGRAVLEAWRMPCRGDS